MNMFTAWYKVVEMFCPHRPLILVSVIIIIIGSAGSGRPSSRLKDPRFWTASFLASKLGHVFLSLMNRTVTALMNTKDSLCVYFNM